MLSKYEVAQALKYQRLAHSYSAVAIAILETTGDYKRAAVWMRAARKRYRLARWYAGVE